MCWLVEILFGDKNFDQQLVGLERGLARRDKKIGEWHLTQARCPGDRYQRIQCDQGRTAVDRGHRSNQIATEGTEVARLHRAYAVRCADQRGKHVADHRRRHYFAVRDECADREPALAEFDFVHIGHTGNVDHSFRCVQRRLEFGQQVGAAREQACRGVLCQQGNCVSCVGGDEILESLHALPPGFVLGLIAA